MPTEFTREDDKVLVDWLIRKKKNWSGHVIYQELEARNSRHTWQSWRTRYDKNKYRFEVLVEAEQRNRRKAAAARRAAGEASEVDEVEDLPSAAHTPRFPGGNKVPFTDEDEIAIVKHIADNPGAGRQGDKLWKELEAKNQRHTWQSWKVRYKRNMGQFDGRVLVEQNHRQRARQIQKGLANQGPVRLRSDDAGSEEAPPQISPPNPAASSSKATTPGRGVNGPANKKPTSSVTAAIKAAGFPSPPGRRNSPATAMKPASSSSKPRPAPIAVEDEMEEDEIEDIPVLSPAEENQLAIVLSTIPKGDPRLLDRPFRAFAELAGKSTWQPYKEFYRVNRERIDALAAALAGPQVAKDSEPVPAPAGTLASSAARASAPTSAPSAAVSTTPRNTLGSSTKRAAPTAGSAGQASPSEPQDAEPVKKKSRVVRPIPAARSSPRDRPPEPAAGVVPLAPVQAAVPKTPTRAEVAVREVRVELSPEPSPAANLTGQMKTNIFKHAFGVMLRPFLGTPAAHQPAAGAEDAATEDEETQEDEEGDGEEAKGYMSSLEVEGARPVFGVAPDGTKLFKPELSDSDVSDELDSQEEGHVEIVEERVVTELVEIETSADETEDEDETQQAPVRPSTPGDRSDTARRAAMLAAIAASDSHQKKQYSSPQVAKVFDRYEVRPAQPALVDRRSSSGPVAPVPRAAAEPGPSSRRVTIAAAAPQPSVERGPTASAPRRRTADAPLAVGPGRRQTEVAAFQAFCARWGLSIDDGLDLRYCCSGEAALMEEYMGHMLGQVEFEEIDDVLLLARRLQQVSMWRPEEDQALMFGTEADIRRLKLKKGPLAAENRRRYLEPFFKTGQWARFSERPVFPFKSAESRP